MCKFRFVFNFNVVLFLVGRTAVLFSGAGKTCLLGNWSLQHQEKFPRDAVVCHFAGCTSASTGK